MKYSVTASFNFATGVLNLFYIEVRLWDFCQAADAVPWCCHGARSW